MIYVHGNSADSIYKSFGGLMKREFDSESR